MEVHTRGAIVKFSYGILENDYSINRDSDTNDQASLADTKSSDRLISVDFINNYYPSRYRNIIRDLENISLKKLDQYPTDITGA